MTDGGEVGAEVAAAIANLVTGDAGCFGAVEYGLASADIGRWKSGKEFIDLRTLLAKTCGESVEQGAELFVDLFRSLLKGGLDGGCGNGIHGRVCLQGLD